MWYKGLLHYHPGFHYPEPMRVEPRRLASDARRNGIDFVFCAGLPVHAVDSPGGERYSLHWKDMDPLEGDNRYVVHAEAGDGHLWTSPIHYVVTSKSKR